MCPHPDDVTLVQFPNDHEPDGDPTRSELARSEADGGRTTPQPGDTLGGRYVVLEELGMGGFGAVLWVKDLQLQREVALKLMHGDVVSTTDGSAPGASRISSETVTVDPIPTTCAERELLTPIMSALETTVNSSFRSMFWAGPTSANALGAAWRWNP